MEGDLTLLPPPISHLPSGGTKVCPSKRGESVLHTIKVPPHVIGTQSLTSRDRILHALTDDAYA